MLETEIKKLTAAIEALTTKLDGLPSATTATNEPPADEPPADEPEEAASEIATTSPAELRDTCRTKCLELVRGDRSNKARIVALLETHNAKKIDDVDDAALSDLLASLQTLGG